MRHACGALLAVAFSSPASALDPVFEGMFVRPATTAEHRCRNAFLRLEFDAMARGDAAFSSVEAIQADVGAAGKLIESGCSPNYLSELRFCIPSDAYGAAGSRPRSPPKLAAQIAACLQKVEDRGVRAVR